MNSSGACEFIRHEPTRNSPYVPVASQVPPRRPTGGPAPIDVGEVEENSQKNATELSPGTRKVSRIRAGPPSNIRGYVL